MLDPTVIAQTDSSAAFNGDQYLTPLERRASKTGRRKKRSAIKLEEKKSQELAIVKEELKVNKAAEKISSNAVDQFTGSNTFPSRLAVEKKLQDTPPGTT